MKTKPDHYTTSTLHYKRKVIDLNPEYQRKSVWPETKKPIFIDSLFRDYDIPKIYFRELPEESNYDYEVVDGQQRIKCILDFLSNKIEIPNVSEDLTILRGHSGKTFRSLPKNVREHFEHIPLDIVIIYEATDEEIRDYFTRLQYGEQLKPAEKRNALTGNMRDFIADLVRKKKIFKKIQKNNNRYDHDDWLSHVVELEIRNGPSNVTSSDLLRLYNTNKDFDQTSTKAKKIEKVLNYMNKVFIKDLTLLDKKWGFVDLYLLISYMMDNYAISSAHDKFNKFYTDFEVYRRSIKSKDINKLLEVNPTHETREMFKYITNFMREGNKRTTIQNRFDVYFARFLRENPAIVPKDKRRAYTREERQIIWYRDEKHCKICGNDIPFEDMHADHIKSHSTGGLTTISNAQTSCNTCNESKGAN